MTTSWHHNVQMMGNGETATNSKNAWGGGQWHNNLTSVLDGDKKEGGVRQGSQPHLLLLLSPSCLMMMPRVISFLGLFVPIQFLACLACPTLELLIALACILIPIPAPFL